LSTPPILQRIDGAPRETVEFELNGRRCSALEGDTVLTAVLTNSAKLREAELGGAARAGFCLMGACQDCWVQLADGERLRACTTFIEPGMRVRTGLRK
jgi:D-hydroxyproline dehydrogenase subunit gamma